VLLEGRRIRRRVVQLPPAGLLDKEQVDDCDYYQELYERESLATVHKITSFAPDRYLPRPPLLVCAPAAFCFVDSLLILCKDQSC